MNLALFDFDGTISNKDSLIEFIKYTKGKKNLIKASVKLLPTIFLYKIKLLDSQTMKEKFLDYFFHGIKEDEFKTKAKEFSINILHNIVKKQALEKIKWHKSNGDRVIVVSASLECLLQAWCNINGIELITTKLEFADNHFTGKLATKNCKGQEKVNRIKQFLELRKYDVIYAYGDSYGDKQMLDLADKKYYRIFKY